MKTYQETIARLAKEIETREHFIALNQGTQHIHREGTNAATGWVSYIYGVTFEQVEKDVAESRKAAIMVHEKGRKVQEFFRKQKEAQQ